MSIQAERLRTTFETQRDYFEDNLGLTPEEWVALLGAHSVGRAAGVRSDHNKVASLPFDPTPTLFDNEYFKSLALASDSALLSLCPQARRPGDAHWFGQLARRTQLPNGSGHFPWRGQLCRT